MKIQLIGTGTIPDMTNSASVLINDHILFDKLQQNVFFKNVKTNVVTEKNILTISHLINMGKLYNIFELYKKMYKDEFNCDDLGTNLSSSQSSSSFI